jgi:hypothetical protein
MVLQNSKSSNGFQRHEGERVEGCSGQIGISLSRLLMLRATWDSLLPALDAPRNRGFPHSHQGAIGHLEFPHSARGCDRHYRFPHSAQWCAWPLSIPSFRLLMRWLIWDSLIQPNGALGHYRFLLFSEWLRYVCKHKNKSINWLNCNHKI